MSDDALKIDLPNDMLKTYEQDGLMDRLRNMTPREQFAAWLEWEGIIGYSDKILTRAEQVLDRGITATDILKADPDAMIERLDRFQPDWWVRRADKYDLEGIVRLAGRGIVEFEMEAAIASVKRCALRRMTDAVWSLGHALLSIQGRKP